MANTHAHPTDDPQPMQVDTLAAALGASRVLPVRARPTLPFGLLHLQAELAQRLQLPARRAPRTGRPSDPSWTIRRLVGFRPATWQALAELAEAVSTPQRRVSPGQVAAHLIEDGLVRLQGTPAPPPERGRAGHPGATPRRRARAFDGAARPSSGTRGTGPPEAD